MLHFFLLAACFLCTVFGQFAISFQHYHKLSLPDRFNPLYGALLIESDFILKAYLYGNEDKDFVSCVTSLFLISDPDSTSSSDLKTRKKITVEDVLNYLATSSSEATLFDDLRKCRENDMDSVLLWAALYLYKKGNIFFAFKEINKRMQSLKIIDTLKQKIDLSEQNAIIYIVENYRGTPVPQTQANHFLHGSNSVSFFNCVESTTLDLINFGMFSKPSLRQNINRGHFVPHWSKNTEFREQFFRSIRQPQLIGANEEKVKEVYADIFSQIYSGLKMGENWSKVNQDLPRISYANFYIIENKSKCKRSNAEMQFVKVDQKLYDSLEGDVEYLTHEKKECSQVKFKHLKGTDIYLTSNDDIILFEIDALLSNFEGIIRYFFGLEFENFNVGQKEALTFENLERLFEGYFNMSISSSSYTEQISSFKFKFNNDSCSGRFSVTKQIHAFTSDFHCASSNELLTAYEALMKKDLPIKIKQAIEYFNLNGSTVFDGDEIKVFSNKKFNRIFQSSFIQMGKVFHFAEKSQHLFYIYFDAILEHKDKDSLMQSFLTNFIARMNLDEAYVVFDYILRKGEALPLKFMVENIPDFDPSLINSSMLFAACNNGYVDVLKYLISINNALLDNFAIFLLDNAVNSGHLNVVKYLISIAHKFPKIFLNQNEALAKAAEKGYLEILEYLVSVNDNPPPNISKFDPSAEDNAALKRAAQNGHLHVVQYLISIHKDYPNIDPSADGNFAIQRAAYNGHLNVVRYLISIQNIFPGIDPADGNNFALRSAAKNGYLDVVQYFISIHKDFPMVDPAAGDNFALIYAAQNGKLEIVQYFISIRKEFKNIDPAAYDNAALRFAAENGHVNVVQYLISLQKDYPMIDPTVKENYALMTAAKKGHVEVVLCLIEYLKQQNILTIEIIEEILNRTTSQIVLSNLTRTPS